MLATEFLGETTVPAPIILLRLVGAVLLCALIGYERESTGKSAGFRTHMLVGLASAAYAIIVEELVGHFQNYGESVRMDPVRLVEAVTAGIAFLAAGMIVLSRGRVKNLTTGAGLWLAGAIGLAVGNGQWLIAATTAVLGLVIVALSRLGSGSGD
jgi:putative Mg2+ transporter-C (MgtC) family protein